MSWYNSLNQQDSLSFIFGKPVSKARAVPRRESGARRESRAMRESGAMTKNRQIGFLKEAGEDVSPSEYDTERIQKFLRDGVVYRDKKMRYWVDNERDCFEVFARGLDIDNSDKSECWQWTTGWNDIETAELVTTTWLGVRGSFRTVNLSQMVSYKVSFKLKTRLSGTMAGKTVKLLMTLPDGTRQEKQAKLPPASSVDGPWDALEVGQFYTSTRNVGELKFAMEQLFESWETGLVIKSVEIKAM